MIFIIKICLINELSFDELFLILVLWMKIISIEWIRLTENNMCIIYFYLKYLLKNNFYRYFKNENKQKVWE